MRAFRALVRHYEWVHLGIGILGNLTFLAGSLLFMEKIEPLRSTCSSPGAPAC